MGAITFADEQESGFFGLFTHRRLFSSPPLTSVVCLRPVVQYRLHWTDRHGNSCRSGTGRIRSDRTSSSNGR
jgi:hypothetical protein